MRLLDLAGRAAGRPVACRIVHRNCTHEDTELRNGDSEEPPGRFRSGSALRCLRGSVQI